MNDAISVWVPVIEAVAWPTVTIILGIFFFYRFKKPLSYLIKQITHLNLRSKHLDISLNTREPAQTAPVVEEPVPQPADAGPASQQRGDTTSQTRGTPGFVWDGFEHFAIIESWRNLELAMARGLLPSGGAVPTDSIVSRAHREGLLTEEEYHAAVRMQQIRNMVAHDTGRSIDPAQVREYVDAANELIEKLQERTPERS